MSRKTSVHGYAGDIKMNQQERRIAQLEAEVERLQGDLTIVRCEENHRIATLTALLRRVEAHPALDGYAELKRDIREAVGDE